MCCPREDSFSEKCEYISGSGAQELVKERWMGKVPGEIIVGGLVYHIGGVYSSQWKPMETTKIVAFIGLEAYKSSNRSVKI